MFDKTLKGLHLRSPRFNVYVKPFHEYSIVPTRTGDIVPAWKRSLSEEIVLRRGSEVLCTVKYKYVMFLLCQQIVLVTFIY